MAQSISYKRKQQVSNKIKYSWQDKTFFTIASIIFFLVLLICAYPFYYLLIASVSDSHMVDTGRVLLYPIGFTLDNYVKVLSMDELASSAVISLLRTVIGTTLTVLCNTYMAYFFTKENMWGRKFWYRLVVVTMYFSAGLIPSYLNNKMLGLLNTFWIYIIPGAIGVYNMILVKTSIESLPAELEESAYLDGAGYMRRLVSIVLPLQKPIIATIALFIAVGHWNDFFTTKLNVTNPKLYTLQFQLYELLQQVTAASAVTDPAFDQQLSVSPSGIRLTLTAVVTIPIMLVYPFVQKFYVKGVMIGAVKG